MATDYKKRTVCVVDNGLFVAFAVLLARSFGRVLYWMPWVSAFPKSNTTLVGTGLPNVTRVSEFWSHLDDIDLFVFPDVYHGALQLHLESLGKPVWGSRECERLELDRDASKKLCKRLGIAIGPYEVVTGMDALREYLKEHDDQWVKISTTRGDFESFGAKNYKLIEPLLDQIEYKLGAKKRVMQFIVEETIDPAVETGCDIFTIDGQFPENSMYGIEIKDKAYVMKQSKYDDIPEEIRSVNGKLKKVFEVSRFRGFWSTELRITPKRIPYLIDPTPRMGSPPGELYQNMISNWPDILWEGAHGTLVEPDFIGKWGAEMLLHSAFADQNWLAVEYPKSIAENVKLRNWCRIEGKDYVAPQWTGMPEVGAVVALGDSLEDAIENCQEVGRKVEGHYLEVYSNAFDSAQEQIDKLKEYGIDDFTAD
jgi:hypothetical protein